MAPVPKYFNLVPTLGTGLQKIAPQWLWSLSIALIFWCADVLMLTDPPPGFSDRLFWLVLGSLFPVHSSEVRIWILRQREDQALELDIWKCEVMVWLNNCPEKYSVHSCTSSAHPTPLQLCVVTDLLCWCIFSAIFLPQNICPPRTLKWPRTSKPKQNWMQCLFILKNYPASGSKEANQTKKSGIKWKLCPLQIKRFSCCSTAFNAQ